MLTQYKNIDDIRSAKTAVQADRFGYLKRNFFAYDALNTYIQKPQISNGLSNIELHVYSGDNWITANHHVAISSKISEFYSKTNKKLQLNSPFGINIVNELKKLKINSGNFKIAINFFEDIIGNYNEQYLRIDEISPDRTEIRLRAIDIKNTKFLQQLTNYISNVDQTNTEDIHKTYLLNFSRNQCILFVNSVVIGEYVYVKLFEPLPSQFDVDFKCWIVEELKPTYLDKISIIANIISKQFNKLSGPNWQANYSYDTSAETNLKSWTDILGSSTQTSQQIVDTYFSGSLSGIKLNIDYSDFNNFIFYSSATERLANFRYKLELVEYYTSQSNYVSTLSGSVATTNATDFTLLKNNLIGGFDEFEKYLYYESSSKITTYNLPLINATVPELTGSYIIPTPKSNTTSPYQLYPVSSSQFKQWYDQLYNSASLYDSLNLNSLLYAIPEYIRFGANNENLLAFTNMLGQHFDILYTYISNMTKINNREENPKIGMPNELLYSVAKQFGWNLTNGHQSAELWEYVLGTNESGIPYTGSLSIGDPAVSKQNITYSVWRRIVNNIPMLLKSKGTKRSIYALLACYGIPKSFITVKEYGGPRIDRAPIYEKLNFNYALNTSGSTVGQLDIENIGNGNDVGSIELRFRVPNVAVYPTVPSQMLLYTIESNHNVGLEFISGNKGVVQINGTSSGEFDLFNGEWVSTLLRQSGSNVELVAKRSKYGKIVSQVSASSPGTINNSAKLVIGTSSLEYGNRFQGQLQELRFWSSSLTDQAFNNHVKAASAYNNDGSLIDVYDDLIFRLPLNQNTLLSLVSTSSLSGSQPNAASLPSASFYSWASATPWQDVEETYYFDAPSIGGGTYDDNKIRLESNELIGTLDIKSRAERSQYDKAPLDSNRLGVYFSPQTMIDEDIIAHLGFEDYDDYIGDPGSLNSKSYPSLIKVAEKYWKKYQTKNDINSYINMFTLFDLSFFKQLEQILPARADKVTGILIQPNLLERSKDTILPKFKRYISNYDSIINNIAPSASSTYTTYTGQVNGKILTISGEDDNQWQAYLTASTAEKYDSTPYSYQYVFRSGSAWITGSTPYWLSNALQPIYLDAISSTTKFKSGSAVFNTGSAGAGVVAIYGTGIYGSSVYYYDPEGASWTGVLAQVQDYLPTGIRNHRYAGSKLTAPAFNINSTQTIDGGPVVEWRSANGNQLIYQQYNDQGSFVLQ